MKKILLVVLILALAGGGVFAWLHLTRVDRCLAALEENTDFDKEMAQVLIEHATEEKVQKGIVAAMKRSSQWRYVAQGLMPGEYDAIKGVCSLSPPPADEGLIDTIARLNAKHGFSLKECFPRFDEDPRMTAAYRKILTGEMKKAENLESGYEAVVKEVVRRELPPNQELIDAMIHAAGTLNIKPARKYLEGLGADPLLGAGLEKFLLSTAKTKYNDGLHFLKDQFLRHPPAPKPELADAVADIYVRWTKPSMRGESQELIDYKLEACEELALATPGGAERIRERSKAAPKDSDEKKALKKLLARIAPTDSEVDQLLAEAAEYTDDPDRSAIALAFTPNQRQKDVLTSLMRLSEKTTPTLKDTYLSSYDWGKLHVSARVLAKRDPALLAKATINQLRNYNQFHKDVAKGQKMDQKLLNRYGLPAAAGLQALRPVKGNPEVDFAFMHALSSFDQQFAQYATGALKDRLDRDRFVAALFAFLALKSSYSMYEVDVYKNALLSYPDSSAAIAHNLEVMLKAAGGNPAKLPWIHKVIALSCLKENGKPEARSTVEKFKSDPGGYNHVKYRLDAEGKRKDEQLTFEKFSDLANQALQAMDGRK